MSLRVSSSGNFSQLQTTLAAQLPNTRFKINQILNGTASNMKIMCIGASTTLGNGKAGLFGAPPSGQQSRSYPARLAEALRGLGIPAGANNFFADHAQTFANLSVYEPRLTVPLAWNTHQAASMGGQWFGNNVDTTSAIAFAPGVDFDTISLWSYAGGQPIDVKINSGTPTTVTPPGGSIIFTTTLSMSGRAGDTINVTPHAVADVAVLNGLDVYTAAVPQVSIWNMGVPSSSVQFFQDSGFSFGNKASYPIFNPDLTIIWTDYDMQFTQAAGYWSTTWTGWMQSLIGACKQSGGDIILILPQPADPALYPAYPANLPLQTAAILALAAQYNCPVVDLFTRWGGSVSAAAPWLYGPSPFDIHPTQDGYRDIASMIASMIQVSAGLGKGASGTYLSASLASGSAVSLTTATPANVASLSLAPGEWDVTGTVDYSPGATTSITILTQGISTTSATLGANDTFSQQSTAAQVPGANQISNVTPTVRITLTSQTTVYLVTKATFTVSTLSAFGTLRARKIF